jgi:hypothetical protein
VYHHFTSTSPPATVPRTAYTRVEEGFLLSRVRMMTPAPLLDLKSTPSLTTRPQSPHPLHLPSPYPSPYANIAKRLHSTRKPHPTTATGRLFQWNPAGAFFGWFPSRFLTTGYEHPPRHHRNLHFADFFHWIGQQLLFPTARFPTAKWVRPAGAADCPTAPT